MQGKYITFKKDKKNIAGTVVAEYSLNGSTVYLTTDPEGNLHHVNAVDIESIG